MCLPTKKKKKRGGGLCHPRTTTEQSDNWKVLYGRFLQEKVAMKVVLSLQWGPKFWSQSRVEILLFWICLKCIANDNISFTANVPSWHGLHYPSTIGRWTQSFLWMTQTSCHSSSRFSVVWWLRRKVLGLLKLQFVQGSWAHLPAPAWVRPYKDANQRVAGL